MGRKLIIYPDTCFYGRPFDPKTQPRVVMEAEARDYEDYTKKAIAAGKLTGDFTIDRHILPQPTGAEIDAAILRIQAEHPERFTGKPVRL